MAGDQFVHLGSIVSETTCLLTKPVIMGDCGGRRGLTDSSIVGRLIPSGIGLVFHRVRKEKKFGERKSARHCCRRRRPTSLPVT